MGNAVHFTIPANQSTSLCTPLHGFKYFETVHQSVICRVTPPVQLAACEAGAEQPQSCLDSWYVSPIQTVIQPSLLPEGSRRCKMFTILPVPTRMISWCSLDCRLCSKLLNTLLILNLPDHLHVLESDIYVHGNNFKNFVIILCTVKVLYSFCVEVVWNK